MLQAWTVDTFEFILIAKNIEMHPRKTLKIIMKSNDAGCWISGDVECIASIHRRKLLHTCIHEASKLMFN